MADDLSMQFELVLRCNNLINMDKTSLTDAACVVQVKEKQ